MVARITQISVGDELRDRQNTYFPPRNLLYKSKTFCLLSFLFYLLIHLTFNLSKIFFHYFSDPEQEQKAN